MSKDIDPVITLAWQAQEQALRQPRQRADALLAEFLATPQPIDLALPPDFAAQVSEAALARHTPPRRFWRDRGARFEQGLIVLALALGGAALAWWWWWPARAALPALGADVQAWLWLLPPAALLAAWPLPRQARRPQATSRS